MHFIERIFGLSLDGDSGALEALLFLIPIMGLSALWSVRRVRRRS